MIKRLVQLTLLVVIPLATLIVLLNSGSKVSLVYGSSGVTRTLELDAKRNGDTRIRLDNALLLSKNYLDFEFDQEQRLKAEEFDYDLVCIKTRPSAKVKQLTCDFDTKRGEVLRLTVKRQGFLKVAVAIDAT